jgi:hypothetical protein
MSDRANLGIIDLTKVAAPDIRVKLKRADDSEAIYRVPGNAPSGLLVEILVLFREVDGVDGEDGDLMVDLRSQLQEKMDELFALRNADYEDGEIRLGDEELAYLIAGLFQRYYNAEPSEDPEGGDRPTEETEEAPAAEKPEAESSPSTPQRRRSGQRSRARPGGKASRASRSSTSSPT